MDFRLPPLGEGIESATVVAVLVQAGAAVTAGQDVLEVETDKASLPVTATNGGTVETVLVKPGDKVQVGQPVLRFGGAAAPKPAEAPKAAPAAKPAEAPKPVAEAPKPAAASRLDFKLPNLGEGIAGGTVVSVAVKAGDALSEGQTILEIETDKASIGVPSPGAGTVNELLVKTGQSLKVGDPVAVLTITSAAPAKAAPTPTPAAEAKPSSNGHATAPMPPAPPRDEKTPVAAGPATRRLARELGVDLRQVSGSGRGGRVTADDVKAFVRQRLSQPAPTAGGGFVIPPLPDFSKYGPIEKKPFSAMRRAIARNLSLAWNAAPAVTQHDLADVTELEAGRKRRQERLPKGSPKVTMTTLVIRACVAALKEFPNFNASYDPHTGDNGELILKQYYHIGVAVDTERGLVVPVIRNADKKSMPELAREVTELAEKARAGKLVPDDMRGGTFTITNLGGIGGTYFSPIINYPEVAILGLSRSTLQPVIRDGKVEPRLMMPLSLTYDHRVVDGADGARFVSRVSELLSEPTLMVYES